MAQCATNLMFLNGQSPTRKLSRTGFEEVGWISNVKWHLVWKLSTAEMRVYRLLFGSLICRFWERASELTFAKAGR
jgi:hypothetical protein